MYDRILAFSAMTLAAATIYAQQPGPQQPGGQRPEGRVFGGPPGFQLAIALDVDADGKISTPEIENATAALQKLDKNQDGKLSGDEIGWPPSFGGFAGPPGFGGGRGGPPGVGRGRRGGFGGQQNAPARRPDVEENPFLKRDGRTRRRSTVTVDQLRSTDRNKDGRITKDEIPRLIQQSVLDLVDTNKDSVIDQSELDALAKQQAEQN